MDGAGVMNGEIARAVILGTGGFAIELYDLLRDSDVAVLGFVGPKSTRCLPARWLGDDDTLSATPAEAYVLIAIGDPARRRRVAEFATARDRRIGSFVHRAAWVAPSAELGEGVIVYPNATIHGRVRLGRGVVANSNATIGHECRIGAFCNINPGVAIGGCVGIGDGVYVGIGATIIENLSIAPDIIIGAGAVVIDDLESPGTYVGAPARRIERTERIAR